LSCKCYIGTSGYSYQDWYGCFYPEGLKCGDMLKFYSKEFSFTEINSTYYQIPSSKVFESLCKMTPPEFKFTVKAYKSLTHERLGTMKKDAENFCTSIKPLLSEGKLGGVLFQFPYSFKNNTDNRSYLCTVRELMRDIPTAVEFRHSSWNIKPVWEFLKSMNMSYVAVDEPGLKNLVTPSAVVTSQIGYVRFHGRNSAKWWNHEKSYERYDYLYSEEELSEWVPKVKNMMDGSKIIFIAFNNHFNSQAVINARMFRELMGQG
jgi:uncharacterized protein YecE (DUF72 family)